MANHMKAVAELCPMVVHNRRVELDEVAEQIATKCSLAASDVRHVLEEIRNALLYFFATGASVKMDGIGVYSVSVDLDGNFKVNHRPDNYLVSRLNIPGAFHGQIRRRENIGKRYVELIALYNELHPDDPIAE
ncbi:MAG: hypothetical protein IAE81_02510 [Caldilineaceae bacterium]|jgi:predicted histone-like DNA-binding protein|nr:hypothetical protein [Caldilineaceae bacterium]